MITSRNPKVLNKVIMQKLNPLLNKVTDLVNMSSDVQAFIDSNIETEKENILAVHNIVDQFNTAQKEVYDEIDSSEINLSSMIVKELTNPNTAPDSGGGDSGTPVVETKYINDKNVRSIGYGFVINGVAMTLAGVIGKGLGIGEDPAYSAEFDFRNQSNNLFPSHVVNDILKISPTRAFVSSNNGLVDFNLDDLSYKLRSTSHGLNNKKVITCTQVSTSNNDQQGYIAGTEHGINYSPTGERWVNVDDVFDNVITCLSRIQNSSGKQSLLFIGTSAGLYFLDIDSFLRDGVRKVNRLTSISNALPSTYINAVAYNTEKDVLYVATDGGLSVIPNIIEHIVSNNYSSYVKCTNCTNYTSRAGISSTLCLDVFLDGATVIIGTSDGLTVTKDFANFVYYTKKQDGISSDTGILNNHMCNKIVRKNASELTVLHTIGLTEKISISI